MRIGAWAGAVVLVAAVTAGEARGQAAGPQDGSETGPASEADGGGFSLTVENDMFVPGEDGTDRYYTQGLKATVLTGDLEGGLLGPTLKRWLPGTGPARSDWRVRATVGLGQNMYTPEDKVRTDPDPDDRPYAGWLYLSTAAIAYTPQQMASLELQVGVVGPDAFAGRVQNWWHVVIGAPPINGWDHELDNEIGINLYGEWRGRLMVGAEHGPGVDLIGMTTAAVGNVEVSAGGGAILRAGWNLADDFGPPRLRPGAAATEFFDGHRASAYVYAGASGRLIGRDIFLDGNTFGATPSVEKNSFVPELTAGVAARIPPVRFYRDLSTPPVRIGYQWIWREEEFRGQNGPSRFGAWTLTLVTNGMTPWW